MNVFSVLEGNKPIIFAQPHGGTYVPADILAKLSDRGRALVDTDWHINKLYDGLLSDVTIVQSHVHRYVIDANRDPDDVPLYPGQNTTSLCPLSDFDGNSIYKRGREPSNDEIERRRLMYYRPYHEALSHQVQRLKQKHKSVVIYDCHSIRSRIPFLFEGILSDFNIGTNDGQSCGMEFQSGIERVCNNAAGYTYVVNGRFKGGWTTRYYGQPGQGIHAIQMELAQSTYMQESGPWRYDEQKAGKLRECLNEITVELCNIAASPRNHGF
jgi:formiminoglutamase